MGERVVIRDEPPLASEAPPETLGYGRGNRAGDIERWIVARLKALGEAFEELFRIIIPLLGGWRQIIFALGLAIVLAGIGVCADRLGMSAGPFWMFVGGLMIGLVLRVPLRKGD